MAENLQSYARIATLIQGELVTHGDSKLPVPLTLDTGISHQHTYSIGTTTNTVIYNDELGTWTALMITSTYPVDVKFTITEGANTTYFRVECPGTSLSVPSTQKRDFGPAIQLFSDKAWNMTTDTEGTISAIEALNLDGTNTAIVKVTVLK